MQEFPSTVSLTSPSNNNYQPLHRPTEEVRRLFDKAVYEKYQQDPEYLKAKKKRDKLFATEEGNFKDINRHHVTDDNVLSAIDLRMHKQKHTDFFYKLDELKDRIDVYNEMFRSNVPRYMKKKALAKIQLEDKLRREKYEKMEKIKVEREDVAQEQEKLASLEFKEENEEQEVEKSEKEEKKKKSKTIKSRHTRNATIGVGAQINVTGSVKMEMDKLSKKELVPLSLSQNKDIKSHLGPTQRHLSQSVKNSESIKRAIDSQKKTEELKINRLQAIDSKIVSPRINESTHISTDIESKSLNEQAYLKVKLKQSQL